MDTLPLHDLPLFPDPAAGWVFLLALGVPLFAAAYIDWKTYRIPRQLSVGLFLAGLVVNLVRGAWVGAVGGEVWRLGAGGAAAGAADGLLFALAGAAVAFAIFFALFAFGFAGAGDTKISVAIGAWAGPMVFLLVLLYAAAAVFVLTIARTMLQKVTGRMPYTKAEMERWSQKHGGKKFRGGLLSYALPLAIGTLIAVGSVFLIASRGQPVDPPPASSSKSP